MVENENLLLIDSLFNDLKKIIKSLVVKRQEYALANETLESSRNADIYFTALDKTDLFEYYKSYEEEVLINANIDGSILQDCIRDRNNIPLHKRNDVLEEKRKYIINNFEELNNYYRIYLGLPKVDLSDSINIRVTDIDTGLPVTKPIYTLNYDELNMIVATGELAIIIANNPDKEYLKYLTNKIDIFTLRRSRDFSILNIDNSLGVTFISNFKKIYDECKTYILQNIYNPVYKHDSEHYGSFIGMLILFMSIQRFIVDFIKIGILKDFYDQESITYIFKAYGLSHFDQIPYIYQKRILKNLNMLLKYKGSNKVIVDICKLFGYENITIFKYYLLKIRKFDENDKPIFQYNDVGGELVEDLDAMYDLQFVQVPIDSKNISGEISDTTNYYNYNTIISDDKYWGGDDDIEDTKLTILSSDFNYEETKYISLNTIYDLTSYNFELSYFMKFLTDSKSNANLLSFQFIPLNKNIKLFNAIILLFALVSKKLNFDGNIVTSLDGISTVYGFNLQNLVTLTDPVTKQPLKINIKNIYNNEKDFIDDLVDNFNLLNSIMDKMRNTASRREYIEYRKIFDILNVTEINTNIYRMSNGDIATTYDEYLLYESPDLHEYLNRENLNISSAIEDVLFSLEEYLNTENFEFIFSNIPNLSSDMIKRYIYLTIDIFKSYTVELLSISAYYTFDDKFFNKIKLLDTVQYDGFIKNDDFMRNDTNYNTTPVLKISDKVNISDTMEIVNSNAN